MIDPLTGVEMQSICDGCGKESSTLFEIHGYAGTYLECPDCFGEESEDDDE